MTIGSTEAEPRFHVLHLIDGLGTGGAERSLAELLPRLADRGVESTVVCSHLRDAGVHASVVEQGFEVRILSGTGVLTRARELRAWLDRLRPDLVHATLFESNLIGRIAAIGRVPVLTSLVNTPYADARSSDPRISRTKLAVVRLIDALTARTLTAHFHALTEAVKAAAVRDLWLRPEQVTVIPRGRDPERLGAATTARRARTRNSLGVSDEQIMVLNVGRQEFQKGQMQLLQASARLRDRGVALRTVIAGREGAATDRLRTASSRLGLDEIVVFLGHRDDVPDLMAGADIFAFPSVFEGFGGALLEAMALELPIVASKVPAVSEVIVDGTTGRLVTPGDPRALAEVIGELAADSEVAARMGREARERFLAHYTIDRVADRTADLYAEVIAASS